MSISIETKPRTQTLAGMPSRVPGRAGIAGAPLPSSWPPMSPVLVVGVEHPSSVAVEQSLAGAQPLRGFLGQRRAIEIELFYLLQPALEFLEVRVFLFELGIGEFI